MGPWWLDNFAWGLILDEVKVNYLFRKNSAMGSGCVGTV